MKRMRVSVDRSLCTGHGNCTAKCPEVYGADDDGYCVILQEAVREELQHAARIGARNCPEGAITVIEE